MVHSDTCPCHQLVHSDTCQCHQMVHSDTCQCHRLVHSDTCQCHQMVHSDTCQCHQMVHSDTCQCHRLVHSDTWRCLIGEGRDAAIGACKARCEASPNCEALNIVPASPPPALRFSTTTDQNIPWGATGCDRLAFLESEPEGSAVCYGCVINAN